MAVTKQELKQRAIAAIDRNRDKIIALGDSIFSEPELGYKEVITSAKLKAVFDELGYKYQMCIRDRCSRTGQPPLC